MFGQRNIESIREGGDEVFLEWLFAVKSGQNETSKIPAYKSYY
jgi:hypothetical protein